MTFRIDTMGGPLARWLPSIEAAKDIYRLATAESIDEHDAKAVVTFVETSEPLEGGPPRWHIECRANGSMDACIWQEIPSYPVDRDPHGKSPSLAMISDSYVDYCRHPMIVCSLDENDHMPRISCASCCVQWTPDVR